VETLHRPGRVIIASTESQSAAWASPDGTLFSDFFLTALWRGSSLYGAFEWTGWALQVANPWQTPRLEDGEGGSLAQQRGLTLAGAPFDLRSPPTIAQVQYLPPESIRAIVQARPGVDIQEVRAVFYPPSYQPPESRGKLVRDPALPMLLLQENEDEREDGDGDGTHFEAAFTGVITASGTYRVVVYAQDASGMEAQPAALTVEATVHDGDGDGDGRTLYLPLIRR
jgi:hypothetical protein